MKEGNDSKMEKIVSLCKRRGFVFQGSEIYGGLKGTWDLGPLGVALNNNIKREWWKMFVDGREDIYGLDAAILMNEKVWEASGHTGAGFADPMVNCLSCKSRLRVDHLKDFDENDFETVKKEWELRITDWLEGHYQALDTNLDSIREKNNRADTILNILKEGKNDPEEERILRDIGSKLLEEGQKLINATEEKLKLGPFVRSILAESKKYLGLVTQDYLNRFVSCDSCKAKNWDVPEYFNLMFETQVGAQGDMKSYLRPETAQGIFVNFKNVVDSMSPKLPFGIAQVGKAFRNEIAPREFLFRVREFEQMEIEYFVEEREWAEQFEKLRLDIKAWHEHLGLKDENIREYEVPENDLAHYSKRTIDFEYNYPGKGFDELSGFAYRTDHDLKSHEEASGVKMRYTPAEGAPFIPHVLEPSFGVGRAFTAVLAEAYIEDELGGDVRTYLKLPTHLAPYRVAVSPLLKNKPELVEKAREVFVALKKEFGNVTFDDNSNVGKRYRRQDEIGTPYCIVIDFDTLGEEVPAHKDTVTVRHRDTGEQERVEISKLIDFLK